MTENAHEQPVHKVDVIVVGAGFGGVYLVHRLRALGYEVQGFERGSDVGGTWFWNRYPGARCDVESYQYSYSFSDEIQKEWKWTERYAPQPEILSYISHVADRFDLRRSFRFNTTVVSVHYNEDDHLWTVETDQGDRFVARYCVMATGCLSVGRIPDFDGLEDFKGDVYHTGDWPPEGVDFTGKRVGMIGTGSSAVQSIPPIAAQAEFLYVFQRTPNFSVPAHNRPSSEEHHADWTQNYQARRRQARETRSGMLYEYGGASALDVGPDERKAEFERRWTLGGTNFLYAFNDTLRSEASNRLSADFVREKIAETVADPAVAELLIPKDYPIGTKRICVDTDYYATFNRSNVKLIDVKTAPIASFSATGLRTTTESYDLDAVIFATGFDAMTGALLKMDIVGKDGVSLRDVWAEGPKTYLGLAVAGFPNLFLVTGPGSPSVLSNMVVSIEQHGDWIADCIVNMDHDGVTAIEADPDVQRAWVSHVNEVAEQTLYYQANSWFLGANIPGKPRVFMPYVGGLKNYIEKCDAVVAGGYAGFNLTKSEAPGPGPSLLEA